MQNQEYKCTNNIKLIHLTLTRCTNKQITEPYKR